MTPISLNLSSIVHLETICPLYLLLNFLFIKYLKNSGNIPKRILQTHGIIHSIHKENTMVLLRYYLMKISPFEWFPYPLKPMEHINIPQSLPVFLIFGEPSQSRTLLKRSSKSMQTKISRTWTSVTSPKTRHQLRHQPKHHQSHSPY